jgi:hypothetical protein
MFLALTAPQLAPCALLALVAHPFTTHWIMFRVSGAGRGGAGRGCQAMCSHWAATPRGGQATAASTSRGSSRHQQPAPALQPPAPSASRRPAKQLLHPGRGRPSGAHPPPTHPPTPPRACLPPPITPPPAAPLSATAQMLWALCVYLEAVSVFPQLRMMQKAQLIEKFTAHYVFLLGLSRFFSCAHWILQLLEGNRHAPTRPHAAAWLPCPPPRVCAAPAQCPVALVALPAAAGCCPLSLLPCNAARTLTRPPYPYLTHPLGPQESLLPPSPLPLPRAHPAGTCTARWAAGCGPSWCWSARWCRPSSWQISGGCRGTGAAGGRAAATLLRSGRWMDAWEHWRARGSRGVGARRTRQPAAAPVLPPLLTTRPPVPPPPGSYYYIKGYAQGTGLVRLPVGIV